MASALNSGEIEQLRQQYAAHPAAPGVAARKQLAERVARSGNRPIDWLNLAFERFSAFEFGSAHQALDQVIALDPRLLAAQWLRFQYPEHLSPASASEAAAYAERWDRGLATFERLDWSTAQNREQIWGCVGSSTAFYRHYLGDVTAEQRRYGALLARMMSALVGPLPINPNTSKRPRVVFCSTHFYDHTVARLFLPLIESLDPDEFELHVLHLGPEYDAWTQRAERLANFHRGERPAPDWMRLILSLQADAVVYLDLGMHPLTLALAALRLAPVQAMLWGHPVTTGLPSLDYVLSPDLMEPTNGAEHYSETLVRLPGLGHGLEPPDSGQLSVTATATGSANPLGQGANGQLNLPCAQSVFKLMPEQDVLFARILQRLPMAHLHLIPHQDAGVRDWLAARLQSALAGQGVQDGSARVHLHAYRPLPEFHQLAAQCQLNIDSVGWSGGMSSLDILGLGVATISLQGATMRERQTAALLHELGAGECIATNADDFVEKVIALAQDDAARVGLRQKMLAERHKLFADQRTALGLSDFLRQSIADARSGQC